MRYDYGMGITNINLHTSIRYGIISMNDVIEMWADLAEPDYGPPTCPKCGKEVLPYQESEIDDDWIDEGGDYACAACKYAFGAEDAFGDDPQNYVLDNEGYQAQADSYGDIFILDSPFYTYAPFCSPCAPGACYLRDGGVCGTGEKAYCFGPECFDECAPCPYPVYRVADGECVFQPAEKGD